MNFGHCHYAREEFILMRNEESERNPMDARCPHLARLDGCSDTLFFEMYGCRFAAVRGEYTLHPWFRDRKSTRLNSSHQD